MNRYIGETKRLSGRVLDHRPDDQTRGTNQIDGRTKWSKREIDICRSVVPLPGRRTVRVSQVPDTELLIDLTGTGAKREGAFVGEERQGANSVTPDSLARSSEVGAE